MTELFIEPARTERCLHISSDIWKVLGEFEVLPSLEFGMVQVLLMNK